MAAMETGTTDGLHCLLRVRVDPLQRVEVTRLRWVLLVDNGSKARPVAIELDVGFRPPVLGIGFPPPPRIDVHVLTGSPQGNDIDGIDRPIRIDKLVTGGLGVRLPQ